MGAVKNRPQRVGEPCTWHGEGRGSWATSGSAGHSLTARVGPAAPEGASPRLKFDGIRTAQSSTETHHRSSAVKLSAWAWHFLRTLTPAAEAEAVTP